MHIFFSLFAVIVVILAASWFGTRDMSPSNSGATPTAIQQKDDSSDSEESDGDDGSLVLDLQGQSLTRAPDDIFDRVEIEELNLSNNKLGGSLQGEVRFLQNLKMLDLSNNEFTGVPAEIGQLRKLEVLNLSNNNITGLPNELGNLSNLRLLDISGNEYSESDLAGIKSKLPSTTVIKTN